jgi:hypothetical protein
MPVRGLFHDAVRNALVKDGWTITHDPLRVRWGSKDLYVDLGLTQLLAAEQGERLLAVEIKSFVGASVVEDLQQAVGQYILYHDILARIEPQRVLYLAVRQRTLKEVFEEPLGKLLLENQRVRLLVFDDIGEVILRWIP